MLYKRAGIIKGREIEAETETQKETRMMEAETNLQQVGPRSSFRQLHELLFSQPLVCVLRLGLSLASLFPVRPAVPSPNAPSPTVPYPSVPSPTVPSPIFPSQAVPFPNVRCQNAPVLCVPCLNGHRLEDRSLPHLLCSSQGLGNFFSCQALTVHSNDAPSAVDLT